jgi:hypothetical protein
MVHSWAAPVIGAPLRNNSNTSLMTPGSSPVLTDVKGVTGQISTHFPHAAQSEKRGAGNAQVVQRLFV